MVNTKSLFRKLSAMRSSSTESESNGEQPANQNSNSKSSTMIDERREWAKDELEEWSDNANEMVYCELCQQVFTHYDIFYDHRMASESEVAQREGEESFDNYEMLDLGAEFPEDATVGEITACEPVGGAE